MTKLDESCREQLASAAMEAQRRAYAPYSRFPVGAAILHDSGLIFCGANVESASYGLTLCAERVAASAAVTASDVHSQAVVTEDESITHNWKAIAVASRGGASPCGACRQFLLEFAPDMEVLLVDSTTSNISRIETLRQLLPTAFEFSTELK
ncbi:MAG: cytidine deaminase [Aureliella sp.]|jgi:cytidine deaminase